MNSTGSDSEIASLHPDEAQLLRVARALVGQIPSQQARAVIFRRRAVELALSPEGKRLLEQTLARGGVLALCRRGGYAGRSDDPADRAPLWERMAPVELGFGAPTLQLLQWLSNEPGQPLARLGDDRGLGWGDRLMELLAAELLVAHDYRLSQPRWAASPLLWLAFVDRLQPHHFPAELDLSAFVQGAGGVLLDALQPWLEKRWLAMELRKAHLRSAQSMIALGQAQAQVLQALFSAVEARSAPHLTRFCTGAVATLLRAAPRAHDWTRGLRDARVALSTRQAAGVAAASLLSSLHTLERFHRQAVAVPFFDDAYPRAQALLRMYRPLGSEGFARSAALAENLANAAWDAPAPPGSPEEADESRLSNLTQ